MLRVPLAARVAQRENPLLGARSLLVAPGAAEGGVEIRPPQRIEQRFRFEPPQQAFVPTRNGCVPSAMASVLVWTINRAPICFVYDRGIRSSP